MKFSEKWLRQWVNPAVSSEELVEQLTLMGLEVDDVEPVAPEFSGVVVGKVVDAKPHPDADKLQVCSVDAGDGQLLDVVCGAPNARAGLVAPFATVGAKLPGGMKVRKAKLRGVVSNGMLCSGAELGLSEDHDGLLELPDDADHGMALENYLGLDDDHVIDIELTPNRGDCLCVRGIARDVSARNSADLSELEFTPVPAAHADRMGVEALDACACVRYAGRIIRDVDCSVASPLWMQERLRRGGVRAINPAVDVTNYVMLELGQPMHAFDMGKLQGPIRVRLARAGENIVLLDGRDIKLQDDTTVIVDDRGPIGVAGIMGGDSTGVEASTRDIFLESALFVNTDIIGKPRRYDAHTDSAHRYERGVDPQLQVEALEYATRLLIDIAGGQPGPVDDWQLPDRIPTPVTVELRRDRIERVLGMSVADPQVEDILQRIGVKLESSAAGWHATPPSYRYDLAIEEDYLEELARVIGYDNIPRTLNAYSPGFQPVSENAVPQMRLKQTLVGRGFQEVVTFSFVDDAVQKQLFPQQPALPLANPISSDLAVMRQSLLPGLLATLSHNLNRQNNRVKIFETGLLFEPVDASATQTAVDGLQQEGVIGGLLSGRRQPENWNNSAEMFDFFDLKSDVEALLDCVSATNFELKRSSQSFLHPGQAADILIKSPDGHQETVGWLGKLHPKLQKSLDLSQTALIFEIRLAALAAASVPKLTEISRFPSVRRDLSLLMAEKVTNDELLTCIDAHAPSFLQKTLTFDVYSGDKIEANMKSVALGLILQDFSRTLAESEVDQAVSHIVSALESNLGVTLRA